jgi:hypothetical protein
MSAFLSNQILKKKATGFDNVTKWDMKCRRDKEAIKDAVTCQCWQEGLKYILVGYKLFRNKFQ